MEGGRVGECSGGGVLEYCSTSCRKNGQGVGKPGMAWNGAGRWEEGGGKNEEERKCDVRCAQRNMNEMRRL